MNALFNGTLVDLASNSADTNDNDIDPVDGIPGSDFTLLGTASTTGSSGFTPIVTAASNALQSDDIIHPLPTNVNKKQLVGSVGPSIVTNHQHGNNNSSTTLTNNDSKLNNSSTSYISNSSSGNSLSLLTGDQSSYETHQRNLSVLKVGSVSSSYCLGKYCSRFSVSEL